MIWKAKVCPKWGTTVYKPFLCIWPRIVGGYWVWFERCEREYRWELSWKKQSSMQLTSRQKENIAIKEGRKW